MRRHELKMTNRLHGPNHEAPDIWKMNLFKKYKLQGIKAFLFQYTRTFSTSSRFRKQGHEEEAPPACRICSCLAVEYSKGSRVQRFQSWRQIQEKPACMRRTCRPSGKVSTSHVDHSGHNTEGQFCWSRAIRARRAEPNDGSMRLEHHVPPP